MRFARKTDIILIAALVLAAILSWTLFTDVLGKKVDLSSGEEETFSIPQEPDVVFHLYGDGSIAFVRSDCPDKVCVNSGKLSLAGQQAACLPNLVYIKIVSDGEASDTPDLYI